MGKNQGNKRFNIDAQKNIMGIIIWGGYGGQGGLVLFGSFWCVVVLNKPHEISHVRLCMPEKKSMLNLAILYYLGAYYSEFIKISIEFLCTL